MSTRWVCISLSFSSQLRAISRRLAGTCGQRAVGLWRASSSFTYFWLQVQPILAPTSILGASVHNFQVRRTAIKNGCRPLLSDSRLLREAIANGQDKAAVFMLALLDIAKLSGILLHNKIGDGYGLDSFGNCYRYLFVDTDLVDGHFQANREDLS